MEACYDYVRLAASVLNLVLLDLHTVSLDPIPTVGVCYILVLHC
eukprot:SAG11_NODE_32190_length_285_cov_1.661290_1_plen_44_part_10